MADNKNVELVEELAPERIEEATVAPENKLDAGYRIPKKRRLSVEELDQVAIQAQEIKSLTEQRDTFRSLYDNEISVREELDRELKEITPLCTAAETKIILLQESNEHAKATIDDLQAKIKVLEEKLETQNKVDPIKTARHKSILSLTRVLNRQVPHFLKY